ncbi:putative mediator complex subunit 4 [Heterostelium album PN500]|uniref:Mediator of RNA polymerase II transcription subunit 4 n=1 Tax=Heterostelium pallidum (strain ATCC 26659 / Pp 5 / PN500) TaxID=670386 RepID=D3BTI4_HETP5|nr:putative mediator complex subunit 4 [Heterostelium album PN500]EFA75401.1 putative mediator complex subunit 4 [Heterostelium album PN500]|eukprot:XP_020427535.1 putative mediator complex subunit 4 [Heterostelium album PN500]
MSQKTPNNRSLKENITISINEFNKACKILFESFAVQASMQSGQQQQQQQQNVISSPNLYGINPNVQTQQQQQQQLQQQQYMSITPQQQLQILQRMSMLIEADKLLQKTLKQLEQHQTYQKEIVAIQKEIEEKDKQITTLASNLKDVEILLENEISDASKNEDIKERTISPEELISYAHKISGTTSAPYGYQSNLPLMPLYKPPAPQEDMMRSSTLFTRLPLNLLRFYGLAEKDLALPSTPTTSLGGKGVSPISNNALDSDRDNADSASFDGMNTADDQSVSTGAGVGEQQPKLLVPPPNLPISTPPFNKQGPMLTSLDLDLNPDLEDDDDDDDDDDNDDNDDAESSGSDNEVDWD